MDGAEGRAAWDGDRWVAYCRRAKGVVLAWSEYPLTILFVLRIQSGSEWMSGRALRSARIGAGVGTQF